MNAIQYLIDNTEEAKKGKNGRKAVKKFIIENRRKN